MKMDWSKTKTIFILAFLILDIFLAIEFYELRGKRDYAVIQKTSIEDQLAAEDIEYNKLPDDVAKGFYITGKSKDFTLDEVSKLKNQSLILTNSNLSGESFRTLNMQLKDPFSLPEVNLKSKVNQFLKENILYGDLYHYWYTDEISNTIICIQQYKGKNIFQNKDEDHIAMVILYVNEDNDIFAYEQSMLEDIKEVEEKEAAVPAIKAIEALYNKNYLKSKSKIIQIQYGYYTHNPLTNQQILAPTWHIIVETGEEKREEYYVNALEGEVLQSTE
jgi:regulatory protein YycI of two-component signal transduction system YycFG